MNNQSILNAVQNQYRAVACNSLSNESAAVHSVAKAFGYPGRSEWKLFGISLLFGNQRYDCKFCSS